MTRADLLHGGTERLNFLFNGQEAGFRMQRLLSYVCEQMYAYVLIQRLA
jgi:hypothetical protein